MCRCVRYARVCMGVCGSAQVSASVCVLDEFSEYLLETRVNTSADFNTYPIRILLDQLSNGMILWCAILLPI